MGGRVAGWAAGWAGSRVAGWAAGGRARSRAAGRAGLGGRSIGASGSSIKFGPDPPGSAALTAPRRPPVTDLDNPGSGAHIDSPTPRAGSTTMNRCCALRTGLHQHCPSSGQTPGSGAPTAPAGSLSQILITPGALRTPTHQLRGLVEQRWTAAVRSEPDIIKHRLSSGQTPGSGAPTAPAGPLSRILITAGAVRTPTHQLRGLVERRWTAVVRCELDFINIDYAARRACARRGGAEPEGSLGAQLGGGADSQVGVGPGLDGGVARVGA